MSGGSIGQIVGTAIGFYFGGPVGAAIGGSIGGAIGSTFDPTQKFEGPRLTDLRLQNSSYGSPLPLVYGPTNRVSGVVAWSTGLIETRKKEKSGGKGGGGGSEVTTYTYRTSAAVSLSEGPCRNIRRIWANGKLLYDVAKVLAEVTRLDGIATRREADADAAEAYAAGLPADDPEKPAAEALAAELRAKATTARANHAAAAAAYAAATAGGASWSLARGTGLPRGPLRSLSFYVGDFTQGPDPIIEAKLGAGQTPAYRGVCYVVLGNLQLANYGNSLPNLEFELDGLAPRTVGAIVHDICERSGMASTDFSVGTGLFSQAVEGYSVATAGNAMAAVQPLQGVYFFDTVEQAGCVRFVPRGRGAVCVIPLEDSAARDRQDGPPTREGLERLPDFDLPREVSVTYRDPERDYQDNTQRATRLFGDAHTVLNLAAPVVMSADDARRVADRALWEAWSGRATAKRAITDKYRFLQPGDVAALEVSGAWFPFRVTNRTRGANGQIEVEAQFEDPFVYDGSSAGSSAVTITNEAADVGDTFALAINTPILTPGQSSTSFGYVIDGESAGWAGGALLRSVDGGYTYSEVEATGERNKTGTVATALPAGPTGIWDRVNTITVVLRYASHELESLEETDVLNGKNSVWLGAADGSHGEVLQFATATLLSASPKTYELSDLLRGRRATEHEVGLHGTDEVFVFLESDLMRSADYDVADWDRTRHYKGVSTYDSEEEVVDVQAFINVGERAKPRAPVLGRGERDGSNNLTLTWVRRIRGFQPGLGYGSVALDEQTEAYEVDVLDGSTVVRTISATSATASYTAAQQTADGLTPGDPVAVRVYQISATRGRGHAGEFTV